MITAVSALAVGFISAAAQVELGWDINSYCQSVRDWILALSCAAAFGNPLTSWFKEGDEHTTMAVTIEKIVEEYNVLHDRFGKLQIQAYVTLPKAQALIRKLQERNKELHTCLRRKNYNRQELHEVIEKLKKAEAIKESAPPEGESDQL